MGKTIGVDLGTTLSCAALRINNETKVIVNTEGSRLTASVVAFLEDGTRLVGRAAKAQAITNPRRTIFSAKRLIGRRRCEVVEDEKSLPYKLVGEPDELVRIEIDGRLYFPQEISAMVLSDIKKSVESYLNGEVVDKIVVTVPAAFNDSQRQATKEACSIAGMQCIRVLNEPTSAALAYGLDKEKNEKILVCDCGGGTTDVSILMIADDVFQVISTSGDLRMGGDDLDGILVNFIADEFKGQSGIDVRQDPMALQRLTEACERAKCDLSSVMQVSINIPYICAVNNSPVHLSQAITRAKFESLAENFFAKFRPMIDRALQDAKLMPSQISHVALVGGSTRSPRIQTILADIFGVEKLCKDINPDECVGMGAAISAAMLSDDPDTRLSGVVLIDVTPLSLGVEVQNLTNVIIPRNSAIPCSKREVFTTSSDNQPAVDIHVLQGENRLAYNNRTLGRFQLVGIAPQPRGQPQIEVAFDVDANGILSVTAKDLASGKSNKVEIKSSSGLSKEEIAQMMADAKVRESEEKDKVETIETRNKGDALVYGTEKFLTENKHLVSEQVAANVTASVNALKALLNTPAERQAMKIAISSVEVASKRMYEEVYGAASRAGQAAPVATPPPQPKPSGVGNVGQVLSGGGFKV